MSFQAHFSYPFLVTSSVAALGGYHFSNLQIGTLFLGALLPDIDMLYVFYRALTHPPTPWKHHAFITHAPLLYLPLAAILLIVEIDLGVLLAIGLASHFLMDTLISGDGIRWLYPFRKTFSVAPNRTVGTYGLEWYRLYRTFPIYIIDNLAALATVGVLLLRFA